MQIKKQYQEKLDDLITRFGLERDVNAELDTPDRIYYIDKNRTFFLTVSSIYEKKFFKKKLTEIRVSVHKIRDPFKTYTFNLLEDNYVRISDHFIRLEEKIEYFILDEANRLDAMQVADSHVEELEKLFESDVKVQSIQGRDVKIKVKYKGFKLDFILVDDVPSVHLSFTENDIFDGKYINAEQAKNVIDILDKKM